MLRACAEACNETSAEQVLTAMLDAGSRQYQSFLKDFDENLAQFLGELSALYSFIYCNTVIKCTTVQWHCID